MTVYKFETFEAPGTVEEFEVDGEIVETYGNRPYSSRFVALVQKPDDHGGVRATTNFSEGVEPTADEQPTCVGKDGDCSRTVDHPGYTCWQHE